MHAFFTNTWLNFEILRILGTAPTGGADICEVLEAVSQIREGDPESWHESWARQAARAEATALRCLEAGNRPLARGAFLRAANYTRASGYMFVGARPSQPDPRCLPLAEKTAALFRRGVMLLDGVDVRPLEIPYPGGVTLHGYLYVPTGHHKKVHGGGKTPIVINCAGADSIQEELYFLHPAVGPSLGYACVTFDGPGQGLALRRDGLHLRPDWEYVVRLVLDHLEDYAGAHPDLDLDVTRIAVAGSALGGYFALRAASSADPRIKACVALDPVYDMWDFGTQHVSPAFMGAWTRGWVTDAMVDAAIATAMRWSFQMRWEVSLCGGFWGLDSPVAVLRRMRDFTLKGGAGKETTLLERVRCPTLVSGAENSLYLDVERHTGSVWRGLQHLPESKRWLWTASTPADGALQAKIGAFAVSNEWTFRFLDEMLGVVRREV
jgi:pimeloyl-ACP methyl ester carboxylesterase